MSSCPPWRRMKSGSIAPLILNLNTIWRFLDQGRVFLYIAQLIRQSRNFIISWKPKLYHRIKRKESEPHISCPQLQQQINLKSILILSTVASQHLIRYLPSRGFLARVYVYSLRHPCLLQALSLLYSTIYSSRHG
jgi:hypothetical protein